MNFSSDDFTLPTRLRVKSESSMENLRGSDVELEDVETKDNFKDDDELEKEGRKREYNRLAQREFRRRRKEKMAKLEQAQNSQATEQVQEIHFLRTQNAQLRMENESLKTQLYGTGWQYNENLALPPVVPSSQHQTPSVASSASSIMETMANDASMQDAFGAPNMLPMNQLAITSSMLPGAMQAFTGAMPSTGMQGVQYSMAHPAGSRGSPKDMQGSTDFRPAVTAETSSFQTMTIPLTIATMSTSHVTAQQAASSRLIPSRPIVEPPNIIALVPADRVKTSAAILALFEPLVHEAPTFPHPSSKQICPQHLQILASIAPTLPPAFRPTATQLSTPHYYGADLVPSPSLRDRLCRAGSEVASAFLQDFDCLLLTTCLDESHRLTIWGEDPYNEVAWEFSSELLARWGWLVGPTWAERANFWRRQRNVAVLPLPVEAPEAGLWAMWQQLQLNTLRGNTMGAMVGMGTMQQLQQSQQPQQSQQQQQEQLHHLHQMQQFQQRQVNPMRQFQQMHQAAHLAQQQQQHQMGRPRPKGSGDGLE